MLGSSSKLTGPYEDFHFQTYLVVSLTISSRWHNLRTTPSLAVTGPEIIRTSSWMFLCFVVMALSHVI